VLCNRTLLIWDSADPPKDNYDNKILWQSYAVTDQEKVVSIPQLVEENDDELRSKYLSFIYDLGEAKIEEKKIVDYLELRSGFSFWWMTLLVEKCNYTKSPQIVNIIKLIALENWLENKDFTTIKIISINQELIESVRILTASLGLLFEAESLLTEKKGSFIRNIYESLPNVLKALISTSHYIFNRWNLRGVGVESWKNSSATTLFVSYFFNLDSEELKNNKYKTGYWSKLPDVLEENSLKSNWLHLYVKNDFVPTTFSARKVVDNFNELSKGKQNHVYLDSFLSLSVVFLTLISWFGVLLKYRKIKYVVKKETKHYWPLIEEDIKVSLLGITALQNILFYNMFRRAMEMLPIQKKGIYLQENQGWEFGFISSWREFKHEQLIGVPHSTVRYWDLRYFFDSRSYKKKCGFALPLPDKVAVNGVEAKRQYIDAKYPIEDLVEVEALRYLQLEQYDEYDKDCNKDKSIDSLLVLGDYLPENTRKQMLVLQNAYQLIPLKDKLKLIVKPHPMCPIVAEDFPELNMTITDKPIDNLINCCFIAYTSSVTSAAVDAYCAGKNVISLLDPTGLNLSPLRKSYNALFVRTGGELLKALKNSDEIKKNNSQSGKYFYLDKNLPKWKKLLQVESKN
jgi:surface carbohydrate biosynthesis protein (TIGR04326 family)